MAEAVETYPDPLLALTLTPNHGGGLSWSIEMEAIAAAGTRLLRYRAKGVDLVPDLAGLDFPIEVQDAERPVWTAMPLTHREDVRGAMVALLANARDALKVVSGA